MRRAGLIFMSLLIALTVFTSCGGAEIISEEASIKVTETGIKSNSADICGRTLEVLKDKYSDLTVSESKSVTEISDGNGKIVAQIKEYADSEEAADTARRFSPDGKKISLNTFWDESYEYTDVQNAVDGNVHCYLFDRYIIIYYGDDCMLSDMYGFEFAGKCNQELIDEAEPTVSALSDFLENFGGISLKVYPPVHRTKTADHKYMPCAIYGLFTEDGGYVNVEIYPDSKSSERQREFADSSIEIDSEYPVERFCDNNILYQYSLDKECKDKFSEWLRAGERFEDVESEYLKDFLTLLSRSGLYSMHKKSGIDPKSNAAAYEHVPEYEYSVGLIGSETLSAKIYASASEALEESECYGENSTDYTSSKKWKVVDDKPVFMWLKGDMIVSLSTENADTVKLIRSLLGKEFTGSSALDGDTEEPGDGDTDFTVEYIRTDNNGIGEYVITTRGELEKYYNSIKNTVFRAEAFEKAMENYPEEWFEENTLIILSREASSGSIRFEVSGVSIDGDTVTVTLNTHSPEIMTDDMAGWQIMIGIHEKLSKDVKVDISSGSVLRKRFSIRRR